MNPSTSDGVTVFFQAYEKAIASNDPTLFGSIYHTSFLFGGPQGAQTIALTDFLRVIPQRASFTRKLGLLETKLASVESSDLSPHYAVSKVDWDMTVERAEPASRTLRTTATYLLLRVGDGFRIVGQIDHHDLLEVLKEAGGL